MNKTHKRLDKSLSIVDIIDKKTIKGDKKMKALKEFNCMVISGRRWFQRSYGNTYHAVDVTIDGKLVFESDKTYGYEDQYRQTACDYLIKAGYYKDQSDFRDDQRNFRDKFVFIVNDVQREKDL